MHPCLQDWNVCLRFNILRSEVVTLNEFGSLLAYVLVYKKASESPQVS